MKDKQANKILEAVEKDYSATSEEFDMRRQTPWKEFKTYIKYIKNKDIIADIGCGNGRFYDFVRNKRKVNYTGIDISKNLIEIAQKRYPAKFKIGSILKTPFKNEELDVTLVIATLHHIPSSKLRKKALLEMNRITKKDGYLILSVWNLFRKKYTKYFIKSFFKSLFSLFEKDIKDLYIPWGFKHVMRYFYAFSFNEISNLIKQSGFEILETSIDKNIVIICKKK